MKWKMKTAAYEDIRSLQERFNLNLVSAKVLAGRGITDAGSAKFYLEGDISFLHNPFMFEDMEIFVERVLRAVEEKEKVRVFGDRDVDGITSTALLVTELREMGLDVSYTVPMGDEPYGVTFANIEKAVNDGVSLAITVDCGISCYKEIDQAKLNGLDFLVTDHHIAGELLPPAVAIIDPKVEGCGYPFKDLAGCGVVAKCIWALRFARTNLYQVPVVLLHALPGNDTVIIEAAKIENMIVSDRVSEEFVPGTLPEDNSRLLRFLSCGLPVCVFDKELELIQLRRAFPKAEISLVDMKEDFEKAMPQIKDKSLFELNAVSRFALYSNTRSELDTLVGLFCAYIRATNASLYKDYRKIMDLAAIGTISDLMPMEDENRILVRSGLGVLEKSTRVSLVPFLGIQNLIGKHLTTTDISWKISPLMNASGRLGRPDVAVNMLLSLDQSEAFDYAQQLVQLNKERQKLGEENWNRLFPKAKDTFEQFGSKFVLTCDDRIPRGITGILATKLQKAFKAPAMVITKTQDGRAIGSIRSPEGFNCHEFLTKYSSLFDDFGGHACAGGFSLSPDNVDELCLRISEDVDYMDCQDSDSEDVLEVDAVLSQDQFNPSIMKTIEKFEPYGEQNPPLLFLIEGARIENLGAIPNSKDPSSNHMRMTLSFGQNKWPAIFWASGQRAGRDFDEGEIVDIVFRMGRNYYKNQETIQLTVLDLRRH